MTDISLSPPNGQRANDTLERGEGGKRVTDLAPLATLISRGHSRETALADSPAPRPRLVAQAVSHREQDDTYPCLVRLGDGSRVIECKDGIQWILQRRIGKRWRGVSFHLDRDWLIKRSGATGDALAVLQALPERHP